MSIVLSTLVAFVGTGFFAGFLGALVGIGGGIIVVPMLVLAFHMDIKIAVASSLIAVVASSTAAGSVYVGKGLAHMRLAMLLEVTTTLGGICGGLFALWVSANFISVLFAVLLIVTSMMLFRGTQKETSTNILSAEQTAALHSGPLSGSYYDFHLGSRVYFTAERLPLGSLVSFFAGIMSGLLGVGGGFVKVPVMNLGMKVPIKVAAATSNFMIGVTAIASLFVYFSRGYVQPLIAAPVAIGVVAGALFGTRVAQKISARTLRKTLAVLLIVAAAQMMIKATGVFSGH